MSWRDHLVALDTETDGPDPEDARIITACVGTANRDGWAPTNWTLKPERPIPAEAQAVHGLTTEWAAETGQDRATGLRSIRDALVAAWDAGLPVVAYNAVFDLTVLDRELRRIGEPGLRITGPVIDPLVLDKAVDRFRKGSRKLIDVAGHYGIRLNAADAHGAEPDALAAVRVAWKLATHPDLPTDLRALHTFQVEAFESQRRSFIEYRRRVGNPIGDESVDWPIRPWLGVAA